MPINSENQVALISGGTSGIGFATAQLLLKKGWSVVINGRNERAGQERSLNCVAFRLKYALYKGM